MAKNLIPQIAQMLGVAIGEEFKIKDKHGEFVSDKTYKFSENALMYFHQDDNIYRIVSRTTLCSLLNSNYKVVKLPWKPKEATEVYTFSFTTHEYNSRFCPHKGVWYVTKWNWAGFPWQIAALDKGWVFPTREEAEAALPAVAKEVGAEYELPTSDTEAVEPWKPKAGEQYYSFGGRFFGDPTVWIVIDVIWQGLAYDVAMFDKGWVYKSKEEAQAALPKVAAEIGVEYES